jgi:copper(I)-binding protein/uncharacterized protein YcnI
MLKPLLAALGLLSFAGVAGAHVTLDQAEVAAGATTKITLRIPHGCEGQATHTVTLQVPEGFYAAKPMPKAGWVLETVTGPYATPFDTHGTAMTEGVRKIIWSQGNLDDAWYDEFTLRGTVGPDVAPGTVLHFPAVQTCATATAEWTDVSGNAASETPAPGLTVTAGPAGSGHGHAHGTGHGAMQRADSAITLGALALTGPFSRATPPNAPVAGGFLTIANTGAEDDRLTGAASEAAGRMEIHEMIMEGDVMKMRALEDGLPLPAGQTVELKPGGFHLMFMDLKQPLVEGETVEVTLTFEKAGQITVPLAIGARNAGAALHGGHADMGQTP